MSAAECPICAEKYNKSTRAPIACMYCEYTSCMSCSKRFILAEQFPKCMNTECGREWTRHFMSRQFTKVFMKTEWRNHVANQLYELEKAQLPNSQTTIELMNQHAEERMRLNELGAEIMRLQSRERELITRCYNMNQRINARMNGQPERIVNERLEQSQEEQERRKFIRNCPADGCRGFLSSQWKCGLCNLWTCHECHEIVGSDRDAPHTCVQSNVESAREIMKSTRPCPNCSTPIFRIEGCSQMWCTMCNTGFDWKTGRQYTERDHIHNPHYFEYLRTTGQNPRDARPAIPRCHDGGWNDASYAILRQLRTATRTAGDRVLMTFAQNVTVAFETLIRNINHIVQVNLTRFTRENPPCNEQVRCLYLQNRIDEAELKKRVTDAMLKYRKISDIRQLWAMWAETAREICIRHGTEICGIPIGNGERIMRVLKNMEEEMRTLGDYCNGQSLEISETYDSSVYQKIQINPMRVTGSAFDYFELEFSSEPRRKSKGVEVKTEDADTNANQDANVKANESDRA